MLFSAATVVHKWGDILAMTSQLSKSTSLPSLYKIGIDKPKAKNRIEAVENASQRVMICCYFIAIVSVCVL